MHFRAFIIKQNAASMEICNVNELYLIVPVYAQNFILFYFMKRRNVLFPV